MNNKFKLLQSEQCKIKIHHNSSWSSQTLKNQSFKTGVFYTLLKNGYLLNQIYNLIHICLILPTNSLNTVPTKREYL